MAHLLRDAYKDERLEQLLTKKADSDITRLRKAIERLRWASIPVSSDGELRQLTDELANHRMDEVERDYRAEASRLMLSDELLQEAMRRYSDVRDELLLHVKTVKDILSGYSTVHFKFASDGRAFFNEKELKDYINEKSLRKYDETDKTIYNKLGQVIDALNDMISYEHQAQLVPLLSRECGDMRSPLFCLFDSKNEKFVINRDVYDQLKDAGFIKTHRLTEKERKDIEHRMRYGS